jgi:hypothetical protein
MQGQTILDPRSRQKIVTKLRSMIRDGMFIPDPDFYPSQIRIPYPGVKKHQILDPGSGSATLVAKLSGGWLKLKRWMDTLDKLVMGLAVKACLLTGFEPVHFLNVIKWGTEANEHGQHTLAHQKIL